MNFYKHYLIFFLKVITNFSIILFKKKIKIQINYTILSFSKQWLALALGFRPGLGFYPIGAFLKTLCFVIIC